MEHQNTDSTGNPAASAIQDAGRDPKAAADQAARRVGDTLKSAAEHLREQMPDGGIAGHVADAVSGGIKQAAIRLQDQGFGRMIDDVVAMARRYPLQAIFVGLGCGYLLSRLRRD